MSISNNLNGGSKAQVKAFRVCQGVSI